MIEPEDERELEALVTRTMENPTARGYFSAGAVFSRDETCRFLLWRTWDLEPTRRLCFVGCNPSTANELDLDPTLRRVEGYARAWGYTGLEVANAFSLRATDPRKVRDAGYPRNAIDDLFICQSAQKCDLVLVGWGQICPAWRGDDIARMFDDLGIEPYALRVSKNRGEPTHPLYLPASLRPVKYVRQYAPRASRSPRKAVR